MKTFSKRLATFVLAAAMVFGLSGMTAFAAEAEETAALSDTDGGIRLYADLPASGELASGTYQLTSDFTTTDMLTVPVDAEVILDLNGHVLTIAADMNHYGISVNGTLTIEDTSADAEGYITRSEAYRAAIFVEDGTLNLLSGGIRDCINTASGIYSCCVHLLGGTFTMTGGTISGNESPNAEAGAIRVWTGSTFTMTGGTITSNTAGGDGAAIYATASGPGDAPAVVNISGGTITGNTAGGSGGGIYSNYANVTFSGDSLLYGNTADEAGSDLYKAGPDNYTTTIRDQFGTEMVMDNRILNGWYRDSADDRWNYVRGSDETNYTERYGETTITEQDVALIAAFDATAERPGPFPNKLDLEDEYNEDILLNEDEYTAESWALFAAALDNARDRIERDDVTQEEVDAAEQELMSTKAALKVKPVNYAVRLWGIGTDTYSYDDGETTETAGLTFGPATGESYVESYKAHLTKEENDADNGKYCIHWMTWEEIIAMSRTNPKRLQDCLQYGCTKTVELTPNETLFNMTAAKNAATQGYVGDGVSTLYYLLNGAGGTGNYTYGAVWNVNYDNVSEKDPANIYSRSRMRATLTGDSADARAQVEAGGNDYYGLDTICDETDCLLSCFPEELQGALVPRTTLNTGNGGDNSTCVPVNDKTTYDKLFLFSLREYGIEESRGLDDSGGDDYGIFSTDGERVAYEFDSVAATGASARNVFTRSRFFTTKGGGNNFGNAFYVDTSGTNGTSKCNVSRGLSPGFCLPGPEEWPEYLTILLDDEEREIFYTDIDDILADTPTETLTDADGNKVEAQFVSLRDLIGVEGDFCTYTVTTSDGTETVGLPADAYLYRDADAGVYRTAVDGGDAGFWIADPSVIEVVRTHTWDVEWDWSEDYSSATAYGTCALCGREETAEAVITSETLEPTGREEGETVYTAEATFSDGTVVTDTATEILPKEGEPEEYDVKYAVTIWGIMQDVDDEGNSLGLTFGPATGADYRTTYVAHMTKGECDPENGSYCIHWMTWDQIVEQSRVDPTVFQDCLEYGCTHSVLINYNETLAGSDRYEVYMDRGDGASTIHTSINENYITWNGGSDDGTGGWPASQLRAVLNGKDELTGDNAPYALDEKDSLYSCLPEELQAGIVPKAVKTDTVATDREGNNVTTYDKLWLFSVSESFATDYTAYFRPNEGNVYQRPARLTGTSSDFNTNLIACDEEGSTDEIWRLRSFGESNSCGVGINSKNGEITQTAYDALDSLSFGFCLEGPDGPAVNYAVKIWGIGEDTYSEDGGETTQTAGLTFGPATGDSYLMSAKSCGSDYCIHDMTWEEIIEQCEEDPMVFESCLENGCTKAVELTTNGKLFNMETVNNVVARNYTGDGVGTLYYLLNGTGSSYGYGANWNASYSGRSDADLANLYSRSRIRTTLTGDADNIEKWMEENPTANDYYGISSLCNEYNCLLSCFPQELREAVVPRTTENAGSPTSGTSAEDETTYDKLFLFSLREIGLTDYAYDDGGGEDYGVNTDYRVYEFSDTDAVESAAHVWHTRSRSTQYNYYTSRVSVQGTASAGASSAAQGLSPGFCLPGPEDWTKPDPEEPTVSGVTITSTMTGDTKTYDGTGVSLTASATTSPSGAKVTYQWYKMDDNDEYKAIDGETYSVLNIDGNVADSGTYQCVVTATNSMGEASGEAEITFSITAAAQAISYANTAVSKTVGDAAFTNTLTETTVSKEAGAGITYTSSDTSVATVDANGKVTIRAAGETTITATAAETANYEAASASYTLTVTEAEEPRTTVDKKELENEIAEIEDWISGQNEDDYTADSWSALENALASARNVLNDESATQTQVDDALAALQTAKDSLVKKSTDSGNGGNGGNTKNGLYMIEKGKLWGYYVNGNVDTSYTGFAENDNGKWYVVDGYIRFNQNTVAKDTTGVLGTKGTWYYVIGNKVQESFTGLADYSNANGWWYIVKGKVDFSHNGVDKNKNGWFYVTGGKVQFGFTGLANYSNANGWWYIVKGKVDFSHNGVDKNKNGWWYVTGGKVQFGYSGVANYRNSNGWWVIKNGKVDFTFNGVASNKNGTWYAKGGKVDFSFSGRVLTASGRTYNIVNGKAS